MSNLFGVVLCASLDPDTHKEHHGSIRRLHPRPACTPPSVAQLSISQVYKSSTVPKPNSLELSSGILKNTAREKDMRFASGPRSVDHAMIRRVEKRLFHMRLKMCP